VIFPQCPKSASWSFFQFNFNPKTKSVELSFPFRENPESTEKMLKDLVDSLVNSRQADANRLYIGGLSMGGFGTFDLIARYPGYFAAAFPISGGGDTSLAPRVAGHTAAWIFHGDADPLVNVNYSRYYFHALEQYRADVKYTEYPGVKHNAWDNAFAEKELMSWLFSKTRIGNPAEHRSDASR
jgi:predicted peptidase